jgi:hypothetical protein
MKPKERRIKQNIMCYMLISNNKQLKYRVGDTAWECGILPRDNLPHLMSRAFKSNTLGNTQILNKIYRVKLYHGEPSCLDTLHIQKLTKYWRVDNLWLR